MKNLTILGSLLVLVSPAMAEDTPAKPEPTVIRLGVEAKATPTPPLKYRLLPSITEQRPGNAAVNYLRAISPEVFNQSEQQKFQDQRDLWLEIPLKDLPIDQIPSYSAYPFFHHAARCAQIDWQMESLIVQDGFNTLLPDLGAFRQQACRLAIQVRIELKQGNIDQAMTDLSTILALSRHLGEHPTLIGHLVGTSIGRVALQRVEELIQLPDAPNLYWALTELPDSLISARAGIRSEEQFFLIEFGRFVDFNKVWDQTEQNLLRQKLVETLSQIGINYDATDEVDTWIRDRSADPEAIKGADTLLRKAGVPAQNLGNMPPLQRLFLADYLKYRSYLDRGQSIATLPIEQAQRYLAALEVELEQESTKSLLCQLLTTWKKVCWAQTRTYQQIGILRTVEAVRAYAAAHDGKLPADLASTGLPVPIDPMTNQPYLYTVEDGKAIIRNAPSIENQSPPKAMFRYEVTIRK